MKRFIKIIRPVLPLCQLPSCHGDCDIGRIPPAVQSPEATVEFRSPTCSCLYIRLSQDVYLELK